MSRQPPSAQTVTLALDLLELIGKSPSCTLSNLARQSGNSVNRTFRLLAALEQAGYVQRDRHKGYLLGARLLLLGQRSQRQNPLLAACAPIMDELSAQTRETISLAVRVGLERGIVAMRESPHALKLNLSIEELVPLYWGAMGCCLLAFAPPEVQTEVLAGTFHAYSPNTVRNKTELKKRLSQIRAQGFDVVLEPSLGVFSVAAPIVQDGLAVAVLGIGGALSRFDESKQQHYTELVCAAVAKLGWSVYRKRPTRIAL